jgi:hypothetical protein
VLASRDRPTPLDPRLCGYGDFVLYRRRLIVAFVLRNIEAAGRSLVSRQRLLRKETSFSLQPVVQPVLPLDLPAACPSKNPALRVYPLKRLAMASSIMLLFNMSMYSTYTYQATNRQIERLFHLFLIGCKTANDSKLHLS